MRLMAFELLKKIGSLVIVTRSDLIGSLFIVMHDYMYP